MGQIYKSARRACDALLRADRAVSGIWIRAIALTMKKNIAPAAAISSVVPSACSQLVACTRPSEARMQDERQQRLKPEHRPVARPPHPPGHRSHQRHRSEHRGDRGRVLALLDPVAAEPGHLDAGQVADDRRDRDQRRDRPRRSSPPSAALPWRAARAARAPPGSWPRCGRPSTRAARVCAARRSPDAPCAAAGRRAFARGSPSKARLAAERSQLGAQPPPDRRRRGSRGRRRSAAPRRRRPRRRWSHRCRRSRTRAGRRQPGRVLDQLEPGRRAAPPWSASPRPARR